jgi:replicative DNA helicase
MADGSGPVGNGVAARPHSIELEQALLGVLLLNNDSYDRVSQIIGEQHFYDPLHARIYDVIGRKITKGMLASPVTVKAFLQDDPGLAGAGGPAYLANLAAAAVSVTEARHYANQIRDLALRRSLIAVSEDIAARAVHMDIDQTPEAQIVEAEQQLYKLAETGRTDSGFRSFSRALRLAVDVATLAHQRDGGLAGISTGLVDLDAKLGGLHPSDLLILAGRPSMGKTSLATNIAFNIARSYRRGIRPDGTEGTVEGGVVGFFSLEMSAEQLAARILSEVTELPSDEVRRGKLHDADMRRIIEAAAEIGNARLHIDDTPALSIAQVAARARRLKRTSGLDVLIIDYLQLLRGNGGRGNDNRVQEVSEITQGLKAIAKELAIPVVALSQLSRQVEQREEKRPQLSDLRESGSIEQDADVVMFVYREEYYREREKPGEHDADAMLKWQENMARVANIAEVIIGKQRHGPIGTVELRFDGRFTRFSNLEHHRQVGSGDFG